MTKPREWWTIARLMHENGKTLSRPILTERSSALRAFNGGIEKTFPHAQEEEAKAYALNAEKALGFPVRALLTTTF